MKEVLRSRLFFTGVMVFPMLFGGSVFAATNQAIYPGGGGVTLTNSGTITINAAALAIVKEARDLNGNNLGTTASIPSGMQFYFVLYVDNSTSVNITDVRFVDAIDTGAFTVVPTSFEILNSVAAPGIEMTAGNDTAWATAGTGGGTWNGLTWGAMTTAVDSDQLDWSVSTANQVTVGAGGGNASLNVAKSTQADPVVDPRRVAVRFRVTMN